MKYLELVGFLVLFLSCYLQSVTADADKGYVYEKPFVPFELPTFVPLAKKVSPSPTTKTHGGSDLLGTGYHVPSSSIRTSGESKLLSTSYHVPVKKQSATKVGGQVDLHGSYHQVPVKEHQVAVTQQQLTISPTKIKSELSLDAGFDVPIKNLSLNTEVLTNHNIFRQTTRKTENNHAATKVASNHILLKVPGKEAANGNLLTSGSNPTKINIDLPSSQNVCNDHILRGNSSVLSSNIIKNEPDLEHVLNQNNEAIYRLAINPTKSIQHHKKYNNNKFVKRLKLTHLKHNLTQHCCVQTNESLNITFTELSRNRPLERRLTPYVETSAEPVYFL
ncbi:uncharacterized protein [Musca autumnalis]|uniref:uncharacterized protein n=1 Tax=Musca autumnalis TaxID=221902 RepID=UPI003CEBB462